MPNRSNPLFIYKINAGQFKFLCYNAFMSKKERVKFSLKLTKSLILAFLTALFGIFAFIVINIDTINKLQIIASICGIIVITIFLFLLLRYLLRKLDELEKMK